MNSAEAKLYKRRIERFTERLEKRVYPQFVKLDAKFLHSQSPIPFSEREKGDYQPISENDKWGNAWDSAWFHLTGQIPEDWKGKNVIAELDFNGEGLVFSNDGVPLQGLTNHSVFNSKIRRTRFRLHPSCQGGEQVELWVEAAANSIMGIEREEDPDQNCPKRYGHYEGKVNKIRLCVFNEAIWSLLIDVNVLFELSQNLPSESVRSKRILRALNDASEAFGDDSANVAAARDALQKVMSAPAATSDLSCVATGHAHIDTGWLWPVRETIRKCARTFSSQIALIERYPDYVFGASQPQHYAFVKEHYPELHKKIKEKVKSGNWELQGAMWVEADCNLISGESMVRQILHGKNFFMDEFGVDVKNLWLPDVFGYSAAMPQILKKSGVDYFVTQKISWSQYNEFPHTTFIWRGIDNSEVLTHFPPENTYNSALSPNNFLYKAKDSFKENDFIDCFLCLFGVGDGGGGPTEEYIENGIREQNLEGLPKVKFGKAQDQLDSLEQYRSDLPCWVGELYLELHRGTLTSQAQTKRGNRKLERSLKAVEALYSFGKLNSYPSDSLDSIWKTLLINQFHDILPGSSIKEVYQNTNQEYADCLEKCQGLFDDFAKEYLTADESSLTIFNPLSIPYTRPIELPASWTDRGATDDNGAPLATQRVGGKTVVLTSIPPLSLFVIKKAPQAVESANTSSAADAYILENELIRYEFNRNGEIVDAFDKEAKRSILPIDGKGNVLSLYIDHPHNWDAWEIDIYYENHLQETAQSTQFERGENGPIQGSLNVELTIGESIIKQQIILAANSKRLDFHTQVDWKEKHRMLRVAFPVDVRSDCATFDIQYGRITRETHRNTSWDMAKFEVAAHRYADLSESSYGAAILNDCKYGHKVLDNILDLNLLRSPTFPDPDADMGQHEFIYSFLPHTGNLTESSVSVEAEMLNQGVVLFDGYRQNDLSAPFDFNGSGISLEVVKKAEKEDALILRMVETAGDHGKASLKAKAPYTQIVETNLLEWTDEESWDADAELTLSFKPFEIRTFKLK